MDKIICIGKNYPGHVREMGFPPDCEPVVFLKPQSVLREATAIGSCLKLQLPADSDSVEHECEIAVRIKEGGFHLSVDRVAAIIQDFTIGLDMTRRDLQKTARSKGEPWTISKVFTDSAIVGPWIEASKLSDYSSRIFNFSVNGRSRQSAFMSEMTLSLAECIALASKYFPLLAGDIFFTGSPSGTGKVVAGDVGLLEWGDINYKVSW